MNEWRDIFESNKRHYHKLSGRVVEYEQQRGNGSYLWIDSDDNNGAGTYIGVTGYKEAAHIVEGMCYAETLAKTGKVLSF